MPTRLCQRETTYLLDASNLLAVACCILLDRDAKKTESTKRSVLHSSCTSSPLISSKASRFLRTLFAGVGVNQEPVLYKKCKLVSLLRYKKCTLVSPLHTQDAGSPVEPLTKDGLLLPLRVRGLLGLPHHTVAFLVRCLKQLSAESRPPHHESRVPQRPTEIRAVSHSLVCLGFWHCLVREISSRLVLVAINLEQHDNIQGK